MMTSETGRDHRAEPTVIDEVRRPTLHLVLSPHYDDTALSIGGFVTLLSNADRQVIDIVIFGSEPDPDTNFHEFAQSMHAKWGLDAAGVVAARRREEADAANVLGATVEYLPFYDAIYRGDLYTSDDLLFGGVAAAEADIPHGIADAVESLARRLGDHTPTDTRVYAPLGVGHHVDHLHALTAGLTLSERGWDVWFYEDQPYSLIGANHADRLVELERSGLTFTPVVTVDVSQTWRQKIDAILRFPSQLQTVFGDYAGVAPIPEAIDKAMAEYHQDRGNGTLAERLWRLDVD